MKSFTKSLRNFFSRHWHYLLVIIFALILSVGIWGNIHTYIVGDDYAFHIARIRSVPAALKDGQLLAQVSPHDMFGFGYGYNLFYGPLLPWLGTILRIFFLSWPLAINVLCIILMCVSGLLTCYAVTHISHQRALAALAGIFYLAAPYHLINLYDRFALAEFAGMAILPLLVLGLYQLTNHEKPAIRNIIISAILLILTHSLSTIFAILISLIYLLCNIKSIWNLATIKKLLIAAGFIIGGTAFFTFPLIEAKLTGTYGVFDTGYSSLRLETNPEKISEQHLSLSALLYSDYEHAELARDKMSIGIIAIIGLLGYWFVRKAVPTTQRRFTDIMYLLSILSLFMTTSFVNWNLVPSILYSVQFPWRFLSIFAFTSSIISAYTIFELIQTFSISHQALLVIIISLLTTTSVSSLYNLPYVEHTVPGDDVKFSLEEGSPGWSGEYAPVGLLCEDYANNQCGLGELSSNLKVRGQEIKTLTGHVDIQNYQKSGTKITCEIINTSEHATLELPLIWYPGYIATLNGQKIPIRASDKFGLVEVDLSGFTSGELKVHYTLSAASIIGLIVTIFTTIFALICSIYQVKKTKLSTKESKP